MAGRRRVAAAAAAVVAVVAVAAGVWMVAARSDGDGAPPLARVAPTTAAPGISLDDDRPRGGTARVAVWAAPDVDAPTLGGSAVRALVLPQLFVAAPDGRWQPWLVEPGTDRTAPDLESATFRIRRDAVWSDGSPITADDLRRTAGPRFVAGVDGPAADGTVTVRFTQPLPGWRRLWSGADSVGAPRPGVWGGPFVVASATPGLETVLRRNDSWWGAPAPFLDEVRLVLVPDYTMSLQLLERGELDVVSPLAATVRRDDLAEVPGVRLLTAEDGGWWVGLLANRDRLGEDDRRALLATVDRQAFVGTLLRGEARVLDGFDGRGDRTWADVTVADDAAFLRPLAGDTVDLVGMLEEPNTGLLQRSMQKRTRQVDARLELRNAEADRVEPWLAAGEFDAAVALAWDPPEPCWRCRWEAVDGGLARAADAGEPRAARRLEQKLRDEAVVLPLWRPVTAVGVRGDLDGVTANGWGLSAAWDAWAWSRPR